MDWRERIKYLFKKAKETQQPQLLWIYKNKYHWAMPDGSMMVCKEDDNTKNKLKRE